jgi:hypothetical protein
MHCFRFSGTWRLYPAYCQVQVSLQHELSIAAAADLLKVFGGTVPKSSTNKIKHVQAIRKLTVIMAGQRTDTPTVYAPTPRVVAPCPRVVTTPPPRMATTFNNITTPDAIKQMPLIHQRHARNNNPFHILTDDDDDDNTVITNNSSPSVPPTGSSSSVPPSLAPPTCHPTSPPPRVQTTQLFIPAITPTAPYSLVHDLHPALSQKPYIHCHIASSKLTPFPLLNLMTNGMVHQPHYHPANPTLHPSHQQ